VSKNIWQFRGGNRDSGPSFPQAVIEAAAGSPLLARLLANRGLTEPDDIRAFLDLDAYTPTDARELPDMDAAVERIARAIDTREPILIYGDFDVDGITGTAVLYETLKKRLKANASAYIPDRATEGHGLNPAALVRLTSSRQIKLVITTDTGITNFSEVSLLNGLGVDTVITDHHALPENLPPAVANVNPQRLLAERPDHPLGPLCGAGVAYKLCELLLARFLPPAEAEAAREALLDIVAVGTVVDMVPLIRENRYLVYKGLQVLNRRERLGFREILVQAGVNENAPINSETLGFTIGPRLNALGRLERADQGAELLTTDDPERARVIAAHLEFLNRKRRDLCDQTFLEADTHLQRTGGLGDDRAVILASPDWNPGIIGIVASRLIEKYHVPVFMMMVDESRDVVRCSARSIPGFHMHDELLALEDYFLNFGGHAGAAGFSLKRERLEAFKRDLHAICARTITDGQMLPVVEVDARLEWEQINPHLIALVDRMAPFGMDNPSPRFVVENVQVAAQRGIGEDERHLKLVLTPGKRKAGETNPPLDGLLWNAGRGHRLEAGAEYGFVVNPGLNTFNGVTKVQLVIEDYRLSTEDAIRIAQPTALHGASSRALRAGPSGADGVDKTPLRREQPLTGAAAAIALREASSDRKASGETAAPQWVDHRGREGLDGFVGQLMQPLGERRDVLIFHEGRPPDIPFLKPSLLAGRAALRPADELILWDLPPSPECFRRMLDAVRPGVIHLAGGKYRSVPIFQSERNYLALILQVLRRQQSESPEANPKDTSLTIALDAFAARLATTEAVVSHGLVLLETLGLLEARLLPSDAPEAGDPEKGAWEMDGSQRITIRLRADGNAGTTDLTGRLEFSLFGQAIREAMRFRGWLLKSPLATIKSVLQSPFPHSRLLQPLADPAGRSLFPPSDAPDGGEGPGSLPERNPPSEAMVSLS
jgi:single-stranded-DNA-specific exonuclease